MKNEQKEREREKNEEYQQGRDKAAFYRLYRNFKKRASKITKSRKMTNTFMLINCTT